MKSYSSVVRKMKPGHGNRDCRGWLRMSNKVPSLCATPAANAGAGAAPTMVAGNSALPGTDEIWFKA